MMKAIKVYTMYWQDRDNVKVEVFDGYTFDHDNRKWNIYTIKCPWGNYRHWVWIIDPETGLSIDSGEVHGFDDGKDAAKAAVDKIRRGYGQYKFNTFYRVIQEEPETYETAREMFREALRIGGYV